MATLDLGSVVYAEKPAAMVAGRYWWHTPLISGWRVRRNRIMLPGSDYQLVKIMGRTGLTIRCAVRYVGTLAVAEAAWLADAETLAAATYFAVGLPGSGTFAAGTLEGAEASPGVFANWEQSLWYIPVELLVNVENPDES